MIAALLAVVVFSASPKVGDIAPDFKVKDIDGKDVTLSVLAQQGPVLLAFFPKSFAPSCTKQLSGYTAMYEGLREKGGQVVAISADDTATQRKFKASLGALFIFVSDPQAKLIKLYDVRSDAAAGSAAFVIDRERRVMRVDLGAQAVQTDKAITACEVAG